MNYKDGLYSLVCGENSFDPEKVAIIDGMVHQDSDPPHVPVDVLLSNLDRPELKLIC